jgi:serine/threonine-protein kinase RsbW
MPSDEQPHIELRILSQPRYLCVVRSALEKVALNAGLSDDESGMFVMAVDEAMTNVIRHGYKEKTDQPIWVKLRPISQNGHVGLEVVVEDECQNVNLEKIKSRPLEDVRPGGLGVHIIHNTMDEVQYERRDECPGVRLTMRKYAKPKAPAEKR